MLNKRRLTQIEVSLTPKQAVLLWLRQDFQGKTSGEYARWLIERPMTAAPRMRVARQVWGAIQTAMKGQDSVRAGQAARQANMEADFLILLVSWTNAVVKDWCHTGWLRIGLFFQRSANPGLLDEDGLYDSEADLREAAAELFSVQVAVERIQATYFARECILAKDVREGLDMPIMYLRYFLASLNKELGKDVHPELVIDSVEFRSVVDHKASKKLSYIRDLAKSQMFQHFGRGEAARALLRPYILGSQ